MGGAVSSGDDNDELVDNLTKGNYIKSEAVEMALRCVDRGLYVIEQQRQQAYRDMAWKYGRLHLSAPCIYAEVLESLQIEKGMRFLNVGSGTGYLSTVVGILLGGSGANHGVELHDDVVDYARERLHFYQLTQYGADRFETTWPLFVCANAFGIDARYSMTYDRIYCGAAVSEARCEQFYQLLKIGGLCVHPTDETLVAVRRVSATEFSKNNVLSVSFASMVEPSDEDAAKMEPVHLPPLEAAPLKHLVRETIRTCVRRACLQNTDANRDGRLLPERCLIAKKHHSARPVPPLSRPQRAAERNELAAGPTEGNPPDAPQNGAAQQEERDPDQEGQLEAGRPEGNDPNTGPAVLHMRRTATGITVHIGPLPTMRNRLVGFNAADFGRLAAARAVLRNRREEIYRSAVERRARTGESMTEALNQELLQATQNDNGTAAGDATVADAEGQVDAPSEVGEQRRRASSEGGALQDESVDETPDLQASETDEQMDVSGATNEGADTAASISSPSSASTEVVQPGDEVLSDTSSSDDSHSSGDRTGAQPAEDDAMTSSTKAKRARQVSQPGNGAAAGESSRDTSDVHPVWRGSDEAGSAFGPEQQRRRVRSDGQYDQVSSWSRQVALRLLQQQLGELVGFDRSLDAADGGEHDAGRGDDEEQQAEREAAQREVWRVAREARRERAAQRRARRDTRRQKERELQEQQRAFEASQREVERYERQLFCRDFSLRLASLELPRPLVEFVAYGKKLAEIDQSEPATADNDVPRGQYTVGEMYKPE